MNEGEPEEERTDDERGRGASGELLGAFLALMPDAVLVVGGDGVIVSANERAERIFGRRPGSLGGTPIEALIPERARRRHRDHRAAYVAEPTSRSMGAGLELVGLRSDGAEFPVDVSLSAIETDAGALTVAAVRDLSEQRRLTAEQAKLATIVRSSLDAIISTTLEGHVVDWNPAAEALLGYAADEIVGEHFARIVPDEEADVLEELLDAALASRPSEARDTRWRHRDGSLLDAAVLVSPMLDASGTLVGYSAIVRDITERKRTELELARLLEAEDRLRRQHAATAEIRLQLLSGATMDETLELICRRASDLVGAPVVIIARRDERGVGIVAGIGPGADMLGQRLPPGGSFSEAVMVAGDAIEYAVRREATEVPVPASMPEGPMLGIPIIVSGEAQGTLILVRPAGSPTYGSSDRIFGEALAAQIAIAFEFEHARRERDTLLLVDDRERIGQELSRRFIGRLYQASMELQAALTEIESSGARNRITQTIRSLDETIRDVRSAVFELGEPPEPTR